MNDTTVWTTAVRFDERAAIEGGANDDDNETDDATEPVALGVNKGPFRYEVKRTGYYCVGAVPVTISTGVSPSTDDADMGASNTNSTSGTTTTITTYTGVVDFENTFKGHLPAAEYPKIWFYASLAGIYSIIGCAWAALCWKHRRDILPIQHYVSATIAFIVVELVALSGYYRYLNDSGVSLVSSLGPRPRCIRAHRADTLSVRPQDRKHGQGLPWIR
jgi:hypothetical protein